MCSCGIANVGEIKWNVKVRWFEQNYPAGTSWSNDVETALYKRYIL